MADAVHDEREKTYSTGARHFHWWTVALLAIQVPLGITMVSRGAATNFDSLTGVLYDSHKSIGLLILALVIARLLYRLIHGAPADEPTITWWQKAASHATHWSLYLLLILIPIAGWRAVSLYGARELFGIVSIPPLGAQNQAEAKIAFQWHKALVLLAVALITLHVGAAVVLHYFIRGDGVLARMLPWARSRDQGR